MARLNRFKLGDAEFAVLSVPMTPAPPGLDELTSTERHVLELVLASRSNSEIAKERGTSARTVANQIASIFRKTSAGSRAELVARFRGSASAKAKST
jgi:DNA-binding CsgD family transcriptional regulator